MTLGNAFWFSVLWVVVAFIAGFVVGLTARRNTYK